MATDPSSFYADTYKNLSDPINTFLTQTVEKVVSGFSPMVTSFLIIYCFIWGWALMNGSVKEPFMDGVRRIIRISFIAGLAMSVGVYNGLIVDTFWNIPDALGKLIAPGSTSTPEAAFTFLDRVMDKFFENGDVFYQKASGLKLSNFGLMLIAVAIWIAGICITCGAFILLLAVKLVLACMLAIGPIAIALVTFEATKRYCDQWISLVASAIAGSLLTIIFINLVLVVLEKYIEKVGTDVSIRASLPLLIFGVIAAVYYIQIPQLASTLGGGAAVGSLGLGRAIGGRVLGGAKGTAGGVKNLATGKTLNDMRNNRRQRHMNKEFATKHPGAVAKTTRWAMNKMRPNSIKESA
ncbi:type IV secretion system protein [Undibacterium sp. SXout7W]|uniref:type IV secretion system protein n=1 Tax=Undibacterium sp. SXout7W TaxID=3413049 RepID=UPI003BF07728